MVTLSPVDVDAYLERIGYDGPLKPGADTLAGLHRAHMLAVPFENLDLHIGRRERRRRGAQLQEDRNRDRRGGWCFELNGTFARLLDKRLGFAVTRYSAAVVLSEPGTPDFAHLTLRVDLDRPWLADVGFGDSFTAPLLLDEDRAAGARARPRFPGLEPVDGRPVLLDAGGHGRSTASSQGGARDAPVRGHVPGAASTGPGMALHRRTDLQHGDRRRPPSASPGCA